MILFAAWVALNYCSNIAELGSFTLLILNRALFAVSILATYSIVNFAISVTERKSSTIAFNLLTLSVIIISIISMTPLIVQSVIISHEDAISIGVKFGSMTAVYFAIIVFTASFAIIELLFGFKQARSKRIRESSKTLLYTIGISTLLILATNVFIPALLNNFDYSAVGLLFGVFGIGGVAYSVVKHGLFDVKLAIVRSVTYSLVIGTLAILYLICAFAFSAIFERNFPNSTQSINGLIISLFLALVFQPIKSFFDKVTNKIFYKDNYNTDDFFARLSKSLTHTTDLRGLLERAANEIGHTLKSEQAFFFINTIDGHYISAGTIHHKILPKEDVNHLDKIQLKNHEILVASSRDPNDSIRRLMISHRIEIILPLILSGETIGYLCLGDHLVSGYTGRDMKVLSTISDELTIAIQDALAVQEIREFNITLQQRIENATKELRTSNLMLRRLDKAKDEFVSMASHQLRTPLTSVKGYISMVLEGDAGKISDSQKQLLDEAFNSSERMVRLINDFLNVSRIQTGKFIIDKHPIDMAKLVEQEIDSLQSTALARNMKFIYNPPVGLPEINIDESKIRQVVMNFADNALYYSRDNAVIHIDLSIEDKEIVFKVKDNGIGVPLNEQEQLFAKFYRASNARKQRPDGTGVGLYLAKRIITAHEGKVIFESSENNGSTFGFRLPIIDN